MRNRMFAARWIGLVFLIACLPLMAAVQPESAATIRTLIVGGGPEAKHNQVAIESNVRYVLKLLPPASPKTVLFADGDTNASTVLYEQKTKDLPEGERICALILEGRAATQQTSLKFRAPAIGPLDGASKKTDVAAAFERLKNEAAGRTPVLLYFTGHGSPGKNRNLDNNSFDLWGENLTVRELASHVSALPPDTPIALVMVQCFSGAFGNLLFEGGDPLAEPVDRDIAGFFATVKERMAAGCSPAVDEREYHDFTSYFFAALTGKDRVGRRIKGADYNHDGAVGMDEAFCYTLTHDTSIDIPVCTSDIFLRRYQKLADAEIFKNSYSSVMSWASPAQKSALDELAVSLKLTGDDRGNVAYGRFRGVDPNKPRENRTAAARRTFRQVQEDARSWLYSRWPDLKLKDSAGYAASHKEALDAIKRNRLDPRYKELLDADRALSAAEEADYENELADCRQTRFVRLFKSVVLAHMIRDGSDESAKRRFAKLVTSESRALLNDPAPARSASN